MQEQALWAEHARFMNALVTERFVVLGGPLGGGEEVLLVIDAESDEALRARLAGDPWSQAGLLEVARVESWTILLDGRWPTDHDASQRARPSPPQDREYSFSEGLRAGRQPARGEAP